MQKAIIKTKPGFLCASWSEKGLYYLSMPWKNETLAEQDLSQLKGERSPQGGKGSSFLNQLELLLTAYFNSQKVEFFDVSVDFSGYTPFRRKILQLTADIPYGEIYTYGGLAAIAEKRGGARAVGGALGSNRTPLIVPCHRVIRSDGTLGGFSSGLDWKRYLLKIEGHNFAAR